MTDQAFNREEYPTLLTCRAMPSLEEGLTEVEIKDAEDRISVVGVPSGAVIRMNMPYIPSEAPKEVHEAMDKGRGLGILACKILEENEKAGLVKLELPTLPDVTIITVPIQNLARSRE